MNPFVFVVGCPRSGTTLLQRMLDAHPELVVTNDTHFIPRALRGEESHVPLSSVLVDRVVSYHRFGRLGVDEATARRLAVGSSTYAAYICRLYDQVAAQRDKPHAGEKTPDYVRHIPLLHELFPSAKILHIIRDGRDVALSALDWARPDKGPGRFPLWESAPLAVCALWWARFVIAGRLSGPVLGPAIYHEVRYEALVAEPEAVLRDIVNFLELPFNDCMLRFNEGRRSDNPSLSAKAAWRPATPGLRDWEASFDANDLDVFDTLVGNLLDELGYPRKAGNRLAHDRVAQAAAWRAQWLSDLRDQEGLDQAALVIAGEVLR